MIGSFRIGRLLGFDINIHWSWIPFFLILATGFAEGVLPDEFPKWTGFQRWAVGAAVTIFFFFSLVLHELSHSLVARHYGLPVSGITLFFLGGVSNLTREPQEPKQEFQMAIVGPLTSFAIGAIVASLYFPLSGVNGGAANLALLFGVNNVIIGAFNLLPGFPLDGGRVLRAYLWGRSNDLLAATKTASRVGQIVANLIMAAGVVVFIVTFSATGLILFLVGNFLRSASAASYQQLFVETVLKGIPATVVARSDFVAIGPETTVAQLIEDHILAGQGRAFPVMAGEELLGIITLTDTRKVPRDEWREVTVYRAMTPLSRLSTVTAKDELPQVLAIMAAMDINQVPLMDGRLLRGLIHRADVIRYIQTRQEIGAGIPR